MTKYTTPAREGFTAEWIWYPPKSLTAKNKWDCNYVGYPGNLYKYIDKGLAPLGGYPFCNVDHFFDTETKEKKVRIVMAVAGFSKKDIEVSHDREKNLLTVKGDCSSKYLVEPEGSKWVSEHRGISSKSFSKTIAIEKYMEVDNCKMKDGLLVIELVRNTPKEMQPVTVEVK